MEQNKDPAWPLIAYVDKGRMMTMEEIATLVDIVRAGAKADPDKIRIEACEAIRSEFGVSEGGSDTIDRACMAIMNAGKE